MRRPSSLLAPLVGAALLLAACDARESQAAEAEPASPPPPPAVVEVHPLVRVEAALDDPATSRTELWDLGVEVLGWDLVASGDPAAIPGHELRAWLEEDLRLSGIGDWPYETAHANFRGPDPGLVHD